MLDTIKLAKSFVIYLHAEAVSVNIELQKKFGTTYQFESENILTWKHYKNMMGEFHELDTITLPDGIDIFVLEIGETRKLTKELLAEYITTHAILKEMDKEYDELIDKYPDYETYIKGVVFPVTEEQIIEGVDGEILQYNSRYVEDQEYSLIRSVEEHLKNHIARWHVAEYTLTDEFYIPALIASITSIATLKIINHRLSKHGTEEAHSTIIIEHFKSNLAIHDVTDVLEDDVRLWLYKNIRYIIKHIGKDSTLDLIVKEILNKSSILTKEVLVKNSLPYNFNKTDLTKPSYTKKTENLFYAVNGDVNNIISNIANDTLLYKEVNEETYGTQDLILQDERYRDYLNNAVSNPTNTLERTKVITLEYANAFNVFPANMPEITIENWLYIALKFSHNAFKTFKDSNTQINYYLNETDAALLVIKHLMVLANRDNVPVDKITLSNVPDYNFSMDNLIIANADVKEDITRIVNKIEPYTGNNSKEHIESIIDFYNTLWVYANDDDNPIKRSDVSLIYERIRKPVTISISDTPQTINEITSNIYFNYNADYDYRVSIVELIKTFTGINVDKFTEIEDILTKFKNLVDRLTSYTTQILTDNAFATVSAAVEDVGILSDANIMTIKDGAFYCLNMVDHNLELEVNNHIDQIIVSQNTIANAQLNNTIPPELSMEIISGDIRELKVETMSRMTEATNTNYLPHSLPYPLSGS